MSELGREDSEKLVSVYDWVFGKNKTWLRDENGARVGDQPTCGEYRPPVDISLVASAIELDGVWRVDDYGRLGVASDDEKVEIMDALRVYGHMRETLHTLEVQKYEAGISEIHAVPEWHMFGWKAKDKPNFDECFRRWKATNSGDVVSMVMEDPPAQNHIWLLMNDLLSMAVGKEVYESFVAKPTDYAPVIKVIEDKTSRLTENKKKSIRRHLVSIIAHKK